MKIDGWVIRRTTQGGKSVLHVPRSISIKHGVMVIWTDHEEAMSEAKYFRHHNRSATHRVIRATLTIEDGDK